MGKIEKIISTAPSGEITDISEYTFIDIFEKKSAAIDECNDRIERSRRMLELADFCVECKKERKAIPYYFDILRFGGCSAYEKDPNSEQGHYALRAYKALQHLTHSDDDFIWEEATQLLSDVRMYFEEKPEKDDKK